MYHQVGYFASPKAHRASYCDAGRFHRQMEWLHFFKYNVISLADALDGLFHGKLIPPRPVVLTFDDGCENFREHAWPVLKKHNFPATMFLIADMLGGKTSWMDGEACETPLMSTATVRELLREGCAFGSHTLRHVHLAQYAPDAAREEIYASKARLEDELCVPIHDFCYPYGSYNVQVRDLVAEAGYRSGLTCNRAAANYAPNPFELPRKAISYGDTLPGLLWKINGKNSPKWHP